MKILISSHAFSPSVGGLEAVSAMLAAEFAQMGHEVRLVTQTPCSSERGFPYPVIRRSGPSKLLALVRWCDVYFHNNISLRTAWPLLFVRRSWVVTHQGWIERNGLARWPGRLKHSILRFATNISISAEVAEHLCACSTVIGNPYDDTVFHELPHIDRNRELIFVGRLVSDKGADHLLRALALLDSDRLRPELTIVGSGPQLAKLRTMATELELKGRVRFVGPKVGRELAELLNAHRIMVVPSLWHEPFGVVALEGIASGCVVVGSEGGGLKHAIGSCGVTFPNGSVEALAERLCTLLRAPESLAGYRANAAAHLARYTRTAVAEAYLRIFEAAIRRAPAHREPTSPIPTDLFAKPEIDDVAN